MLRKNHSAYRNSSLHKPASSDITSSVIYRYVVSLNKKRLFLLSFSSVLFVAIIFFIGFLAGKATFVKTVPEQIVQASNPLPRSEPSALVEQAENTANSTAHTLNTLIEGSEAVNQTSDFNTNDLIFENVLSDEEIQVALESGKGIKDNNSYNRVKASNPPQLPALKPSQLPSQVQDVKKTVSKQISQPKLANATTKQQSERKVINRPTAVQTVSTSKPASPISLEKIRGVSGINTLNKNQNTLYEEYPQEGKTYYYVQLMTTGVVEKGRSFSERLREEGFVTKLVETVVAEEKYYVILIGLYKDKTQAKKDLTRFKTYPRYGEAFKDAFVRPYNIKDSIKDVEDTKNNLELFSAPS